MILPGKVWRFLRWSLIGLAGVALLGGVFVLAENWRGARAWHAYAERCAAAGDPVDVFPAPSSLPPERNFMRTPLLDRLLFAKDGSAELKEFEQTLSSPEMASGALQAWRKGGMVDLAAIGGIKPPEGAEVTALRTAYLAGVNWILTANTQPGVSAILEELRQAVAARADSQVMRPLAMTRAMPPDIPMPRFVVVRRLSNALVTDACAAMAKGDGDRAWSDVMATARLVRGFSDMPDGCLVDAMIGVVLANAMGQSIWEAWVRHSWSDPQWAQLQQELLRIEPMRSLERSMRVERAFVVNTLQNVPVERILEPAATWDDPPPWWAVSFRSVPGWVQQNKISAAKSLSDRAVLLGRWGTPGFLDQLRQDGALRLAAGGRVTPYDVLAQVATPSYDKVTDNALMAENNVALAVTVCALERYRLAHGGYPEALAEVAPAYVDAVPRDGIDGQPLRYRRLADGVFKLYSVGLNGTDDDGAISDWKTAEGRRIGDWCWPQPAK
ncbi:MAG: hypothetical protein IPL39_03045 [Opitutaceae bacterium]|nr:hypothetical protein [Opitutaceae bacterium]